MRPHSIVRTLAAAALLLVPTVALAAPDQNTNNNGCPSGQWRNQNGQCGTWNNNGQYNNGQWNNGQWNNGRGRHRDRDDENNNGRDRDDQRNNGNHYGWNNPNNPHNGNYNGGYNNGGYNNGGYYGNGGYNNGRYGNRGNQLTGSVSSFSPYNLYLSNGTHVELHNGTVINPTGTNLSPGQRVRVIGNWNSDGTFNANEIDVVGSSRGGYRY